MRVVAATLAGVTVVLSAGLAYSQDKSQTVSVNVPKEVLEELKYLVGRWNVEGKEGDETFEAKFSMRWSPGKHCLRYDSSWSGTEGTSAGSSLIGWDAAKKQIVDVGFGSDGSSHTFRYTIKSATLWEGESIGVDEEGKVVKGRIRLEKKGPKEFVWKATERVAGGESQPDMQLHFRKVRELQGHEASGRMPKRVREHLQYVVGRWELKGHTGKETCNIEWTARWAPDKRCLLTSWSGIVEGEHATATGLEGWDALNDQLLAVSFSDEGPAIARWKVKSPEFLEGNWTGVYHGKQATSKETFRSLGPNQWKIVSKGLQNIPDGELHARRISKDSPREFQKVLALVGNWRAEKLEFRGDTMTVDIACRPVLGGRFIEETWIGVDDAGVKVAGILLLGRDPADGKMKGWAFTRAGVVGQWTLAGWQGDKSTWDVVDCQPDGSKQLTTVTLDFTDKGTHLWQYKEKEGQTYKAKFTRVPPRKASWKGPEEQVATPASVSEAMKELEWWVGGGEGMWDGAFPDGKRLVGQQSCKWTLDGKFLSLKLTAVDDRQQVRHGRSIVGVHPGTKKVTGWEFSSNGAIANWVVSDEGQSIEGSSAEPDRKTMTFQGRVKQMGKGSLQYKAQGKFSTGEEVGYGWRIRPTSE